MKQYILVLFAEGYTGGNYAPEIRKFTTDNLEATIRTLAENGSDIGVELNDQDEVDQDSLNEVVNELKEKGHWDVGDDAWSLTLIDTLKPGEFEEE